jgi:NhaA family Na+:H+ antiporter
MDGTVGTSQTADYEPPSSPTAAAGIVLVVATVAALAVANSSLAALYEDVLHREWLGLSVLHWINDGLMALFFLLVGLEIKRELLVGALSTPSSRVLPAAAALAGMLVPAAIFFGLTIDDPAAQRGWAIPAATDIAFALAVIAALGARVPPQLRIFLTAVAIIDDLGAIVVIGVFYTPQLHLAWLAAAAGGIAVLAGFNRFGVRSLAPYIIGGAGVWFAVHASGVHATLAGVAVALTIPMRDRPDSIDVSGPLDRLEHALAPLIAFAVVPVFGFANAGIHLAHDFAAQVAAPIPLAIIAALLIGKQLGVFGAVRLLAMTRIAALPPGISWRQMHGAALLCGIGFTMSLFIAGLAFGTGSDNETLAKIGILLGSFLSAAAGYLVLRRAR